MKNFINDKTKKQILLNLNENTAVLDYSIENNTDLFINRVYVPEEARGKGIAAELMTEIIEYANKENLNIIPICSYAKYFLDKNILK